MGKKGYDKAIELIVDIKGKVISVDILKTMIMKEIGGDDRTFSSYIIMMTKTGLIKEVDHMRFKIL